MNKNHYCIIMAGGAGTRFWPLSRDKKPKQFLDILGVGKTFVQQTFERFSKIIPKENILIVSGEAHKNLIKEQLPEILDENILLEPMRRNTAPCIAYATYKLLCKNPQATAVVAPSDHLILNEDKFLQTIEKCFDIAENNKSLVTVGITPTRPETGYGYIQINKKEHRGNEVYQVKTFTEKPNAEMAKVFVDSKEFFWNSGIFIWTLESIKNEIERQLPEVAELFAKGNGIYYTSGEKEFINKIYSECQSISIDFGVMEKAHNIDVACANFGWSDLGTWGALFLQEQKDEQNNVISAKNIFTENVKNSLVKITANKFVVLKDIDNVLIVDTGDVLLVCKKTNDEDIKRLMTAALINNRDFA